TNMRPAASMVITSTRPYGLPLLPVALGFVRPSRQNGRRATEPSAFVIHWWNFRTARQCLSISGVAASLLRPNTFLLNQVAAKPDFTSLPVAPCFIRCNPPTKQDRALSPGTGHEFNSVEPRYLGQFVCLEHNT